MRDLSEEEALSRLRAQDPTALHWLIGQYNRYVASIIRAVLGKTCREEDAEELTADVFYRSSAARAASHPESCRHILARRPGTVQRIFSGSRSRWRQTLTS